MKQNQLELSEKQRMVAAWREELYREYYEKKNGDLDDLIFNSFFETKKHSEK